MITNNSNYPTEGLFEINANTRVIAVPTDFSKNGVGVVGDNCAETLEFTIARYFDKYDLGNATAIEVRWTNPSGVSKVYPVPTEDINKELPDVIKFNWILTKDAIGAKSGNIKFNVRISIGDVKLNTQSQIVSVKAGLDMPADAAIEESDDALALRKGLLPDELAQAIEFKENKNLPATAGLETVSVELKEAVATYGDSVKATWYKDGAAIANETGLSYTITEPGEYQVVLTTSKKIVDETAKTIDGQTVEFKYHTSIASVASNKCKVGSPSLLTIVENLLAFVNGTALSMKVAKPAEGTVTAKLLYRANKDAVAAELEGSSVTIGEAVDNKLPLSATVAKDGLYSIELTHSLNNGTKTTLSSEAEVVLDPVAPIVTILPDGDYEVGEVELTANVTNLTALDTVTYQWMFKDSRNGTLAPIANATESTYSPTEVSEGGQGSGYYAVEVTNTKLVNKANKTAKGSATAKKIS